MATTAAAPNVKMPGPVAHNDTIPLITADTSVMSFIIPASQLLANDTALPGAANAIHIQSAKGISGASVAVDPKTGDITVTPTNPYHPSDTFSYTIADGRGNTSTATVAVNYTVANNPPVISGPGSINIPVPTNGIGIVDVPFSDLLANVSDPDGDVVSISGLGSVTSDSHVGENWDPSLEYIGVKGIIEFANHAGPFVAGDSVTFNYVATDSASLSAIGSFTINIT